MPFYSQGPPDSCRYNIRGCLDRVNLKGEAVKTEDITDDTISFGLQKEPQMNGEIQAVIDIAAERSGYNVILDFTFVDIITSSSLTKLLKLRQTVMASGKRLVLCGMHPFTRSAFEVTGLNGVFDLAADKQAALEVVNSGCLAGT